MTLLKSFLAALSTYSVIPTPQFEWNSRSTQYAICFFPAVGLVCGGVLLGWYVLCIALGIGEILFAVVAACLPLLLTGGIHMDGYMDTVDALASHQPRERKLEILKDSCCGAFAVIYCGVYLLLGVGLYYGVFVREQVYALVPMFVLSRALSALCAVTMPNARKSGMLCAFTKNTKRTGATVAMIIVALLAAMGIILLSPVAGALGVLFGLISMLCYRRMAKKQFGGVTGDTAGFFLQVCELAVLLGVWIGGLI